MSSQISDIHGSTTEILSDSGQSFEDEASTSDISRLQDAILQQTKQIEGYIKSHSQSSEGPSFVILRRLFKLFKSELSVNISLRRHISQLSASSDQQKSSAETFFRAISTIDPLYGESFKSVQIHAKEIHSQLKQKSSELLQVQAQLQQKTNELGQLQAQFQQSSSDHNLKEAASTMQITELMSKIENLSSERSKIESSVQSYEVQSRTIESELSKCHRLLEANSKKMQSEDSTIKDLQGRLAISESENKRIKELLDKSEKDAGAKVEKLQSEIERLTQQNDTAKASFEDEIESIRARIEEEDSLRQKELLKKLEKITKKNHTMKDEMQTIRMSQMEREKGQKEDCERQKEELRRTLEDTFRHEQSLRELTEKQLRQTVEELQMENKTMKSQQRLLSYSLEKAEGEVARLQSVLHSPDPVVIERRPRDDDTKQAENRYRTTLFDREEP